MTDRQTQRVAIVVLGEIGQSPRMQLHARALVDHGVSVDVIAYAGDVTPDWLRTHPRIGLWLLPAPGWAGRHQLPRAIFILYALCRVARLSCSLLWTLMFRTPRPDFILLQTPPPFPTIAACLLAARWRGSTAIIDWHNYGHTILALHLGDQHWAVGLTFWSERTFGRLAARHLCVSQAMRRDLAARWGIPDAVVLYDRPPARFSEASDADRLRLFEGLSCIIPENMARARATGSENQPGLLVSPTSWTVDEDFALLLDALEHCDAAMAKEEEDAAKVDVFPDLIVLLTGNGPMRQVYEQRIASLVFRRIVVRTSWLSDEDFPVLLGSSDLGLCLHTSSSGVDLPMKIAEMQGANLPVCAFDYGACLTEMVDPGETGLLFSDSATLSQQLRDLFRNFPAGASQLSVMRNALRARPRRHWGEEWDDVAAPYFELASSRDRTAPVEQRV
jgi:beta-1,4-mannosyltransferase